MAGSQSTLGDDGIAEELAAEQRAISVAEFFEKNKHMLGFDSNARSLITAVKEGVDNALDATEEAGILPDVAVEIQETGDYYTVIIEDNGPGIPDDNVPKVFGKLLYGSRFGSMTMSRGQQGIGISAAVLYSQITSGKPAKITSRPKGAETAHYTELTLNTDTNEPSVTTSEPVDWDKPHGTRIHLEMEANMRARTQLYEYIKTTGIVNPHTRLTFDEPSLDEPVVFERAVDELPQQPEEIKPHPHGVELGHVIKMLETTTATSLSGFLQEEFSRVGTKRADSIIDTFRDDYHGREMAWDATKYTATADTDTLTAVITDAVRNKASEKKTAFAERVTQQVFDAPRVSHSSLEQIVTDAAEHVETAFSARFGSTVRDKTHDAVWRAIRSVHADDTVALVDDATHSRKDTTAVRLFGREIAVHLTQTAACRATHDDIVSYVDAAAATAGDYTDETFGDTARQKVVDSLWGVMETPPIEPPQIRELTADRAVVGSLLVGMNETSIPRPSTKCLSPISADKLEAGLRAEYDADFYSSTARDAGVHSGHPFIVEAGLAYGGDIEADGTIELLRFANRVPLVYQPGACGITQTVKQIGWRNYKLSQPGGSGLPDGPVALMIHVGSTNVPFTSESKDALASVPDIEYQIEQAVREVSRDLKKYLKKRSQSKKRQRKQNVIADILPSMADKLGEAIDERPPDTTGSLARVMNNVLITRNRGDHNTVHLELTNFSNTAESLAVTEAVDSEPTLTAGDADIHSLSDASDDTYHIQWDGSIPAGSTHTLTYRDASPTATVEVSDIDAEKLTVLDE